MDPDTFFERNRRNLINQINGRLSRLVSAKAQTTTWIRHLQEDMGVEIDVVDRAFDSR